MALETFPGNWVLKIDHEVNDSRTPQRIEGPVMTPKEEAKRAVDAIPDAAPLTAVLAKLEDFCGLRRAIDQCDRGQTIPHDEVFRRIEALNDLLQRDCDAVCRLERAMAESDATWSLRDRVGFLVDDLDVGESEERLVSRLEMLTRRSKLDKRTLAAELGIDPSEILDELPNGDENDRAMVRPGDSRSQPSARADREGRGPANGSEFRGTRETSDTPT